MRATELATRLANDAEAVCVYLLPNGVRRGRDWCAGSVNGDAGRSLKVCLVGPKVGQWADFGGDESGDLIGLWQAAKHCDLATACREAEQFLGIEPDKPVHRVPQRAPERVTGPCPDDSSPDVHHARYGRPTRSWRYLDAQGRLLGVIARFDPPGERKQILPWTWADSDGWQCKAFSAPRPLYGLQALAARSTDPVLLVEGEKAAEAAQDALKGFVVVTWSGGSKAVSLTDWTPLIGRRVTLWPDADEPGKAAMLDVAKILNQPVRLLNVDDQPDGWDIADAVSDGWTGAQIARWCKARVTEHQHEDEPGTDDGPLDVFTTAPLPTLRRDMLPLALADFIFDQSQLIGSDPCILAVSSLVCCAAMTHDSIKLQPKLHDFTWKESARLWGAFVGDPSVKKSPPLQRATAPLKRLDIQYGEEGEDALRRYAIDLKIHGKIEAKHVNAAAADRMTGSLEQPPSKPAVRQIIAQDTTTEALAMTLVDNPGGVLCLFDELAEFFGQMDAYRATGGKDKAFWLESYNGGAKSIDRITRGRIRVPNLSTCILGGIQPAPMRAQASKMVDDGLLQRFMVVIAQSSDEPEQDREPNRAAMDAYNSIIEWMAAERGDPNRPVTLSEAARCVMDRVNERLRGFSKLESIPLRMRYQLGKWQGLFCRLALTFHAIECASSAVSHTRPVTGDTAERVERFMFDYLYRHLWTFYDDILGSGSTIEHVQWVAGHLLANGLKEVTSSVVFRSYKAWRSLPKDLQRGVMQFLEMSGWLIPIVPENPGVQVKRWVVDERVHTLFLKRAVQEKERRDRVKAGLQSLISKTVSPSEAE